MSGPIVIYWGYRFSNLFASVCDDLEEAAREAWIDAQRGDASFACIEIIEGGESRTADVGPLWRAWDAEEDAEVAAQRQRPIVSVTEIRAPAMFGAGEKWVALDWYRDADEAQRHIEHYAKFGERVRFQAK